MAERTEISFEVPPEEVAVLDGYCSAKNITRKTVICEPSGFAVHKAEIRKELAAV